MPLQEHLYSVLVVSATEKFNRSLCTLLPETEYDPVHIAFSATEAQHLMAERAYDLVIVNTPLPDDFGRKLAIDICLDKHAVVLLLVRNEVYEETYLKVFDYGVLALRKPTSLPVMLQSLDWMRAMRERLRRLERKTISLEEKMAEIRIVNRAKWALINACKMAEADAHRFIEKQAMDRCVTRREIAEGILQTYAAPPSVSPSSPRAPSG